MKETWKARVKGSKTFRWATCTKGGFMKQNEWKKIRKLEKKGSKTLQPYIQRWDS
jgi:hypothetical protein